MKIKTQRTLKSCVNPDVHNIKLQHTYVHISANYIAENKRQNVVKIEREMEKSKR